MTDYWLNKEFTNAEVDEALSLMQEECAEIIQNISKIRRFGFNSYHPDDTEKRTNRLLLNDEVGDFETIKKYLVHAGIIDPNHLEERIKFKEEKLQKYSRLFCN